MKDVLSKFKDHFSVFADMRGFKPSGEDAQKILIDVQSTFKARGLKKSVVILDNIVGVMQMKRLGKESGVYEHERYISPENNPNWEQQALDWLTKDIDPDKK